MGLPIGLFINTMHYNSCMLLFFVSIGLLILLQQESNRKLEIEPSYAGLQGTLHCYS
jgi:hypothetical protein